jgi:hypothetical protein
MKFGAEDKKKLYALGVLGVVAVIAFYTQVLDNGSSPAPAPKPAASSDDPTAAVPAQKAQPSAADPAPRASTKKLTTVSRGDDFRPVLHSKRPEDRIDPLTVDPTLRKDLLAKVQAVEPEGGLRNLFQFGAKPVEKPKDPEPKIVVAAKMFDYPRPLAPPPPPQPPPPPPPEPPINLKYYGVATKTVDGKKTALFLDGENTILAPEGSIVNKKYKVVRVGATSVLMENTENKKQQTLPLSEDAGASMSN